MSPPRTTTRRSARRRMRGFSLVETALVGTLGALLMSTAAPGLRGLLDRQRLDGVAGRLAADVQYVRAETVARNEALRISFYSAGWGSCWVVHSGPRDQCACAASGPAQCTGDAKPLKTVALAAEDRVSVQANVASIGFDPLHGTGTPTGTLKLIAPNGQAVHHVVNVMGRVRTCSPASAGVPAVSGYRVC